MTNFELSYIAQNTPAVVENVFTGLLWRGRNASETIRHFVNHAQEFHYCDADLFRASINAALRSAMESEKTFRAFINNRREELISPATKNVADYIRVMWEQTDPPEKVFAYLKNNL